VREKISPQSRQQQRKQQFFIVLDGVQMVCFDNSLLRVLRSRRALQIADLGVLTNVSLIICV
jgi:hypothetical protein